MGRWSQAKRRGGSNQSNSAARPPYVMVSAHYFANDTVTIIYSGPVNAADFSGGAVFTDDSSGGVGVNIVNRNLTTLDVSMDQDGGDGDQITQDGGPNYVTSPDSILTH